jgi:hypothetical protein
MHGSLAVTTGGLPLGLTTVKFWTRKKFKGTAALKKKVNPTRVPIEKKESVRWLENVQQTTALFGDPGRCIHIGDRESDIYELFCLARDAGTHFLIRTCVNRLAGDGEHTIADEMDEIAVKGVHRIEVRDGNGDPDQAVLEIRYRKIHVLPPVGKQRRYRHPRRSDILEERQIYGRLESVDYFSRTLEGDRLRGGFAAFGSPRIFVVRDGVDPAPLQIAALQNVPEVVSEGMEHDLSILDTDAPDSR